MTTISEWVKAHDPKAVERISKRIKRYADNSTDPATSAAAEMLVDLISKEQANAPSTAVDSSDSSQ